MQGQADYHIAAMQTIVETLERLASEQPSLFDAPRGYEERR